MAYVFDGTTKRITLTSGVVSLNLIDLHSRWKDWVGMGNAQHAQAFRAVGGDIPAIPLYLFLLNGWRIVPQSADHTLAVTNGILEVDGGGDPFVDPVGDFAIRLNRETPGIAIGYSSTGVSGPTAAEIAAAILAAAQVTPIYSDIRKVNNLSVNGSGTDGDPWGP